MIKPIKQNLTFGTTQSSANLYSNVTQFQKTPEPVVENNEKPNKSFTESVHSAKRGITNIIKGFNNVTNTSSGIIRGVVDGICTAALVGTFAKNLKEHDSKFFQTIGGTIKDIVKETWKIVKLVPSFIIDVVKSDSLKTLLKEPSRLWNDNIKGNPKAGAAVILSGIAVFLLRTFQGKVNANRKNANLDHSLNEGHVPTK